MEFDFPANIYYHICPKYLVIKQACNKINKVNNTLLFCLDTKKKQKSQAK